MKLNEKQRALDKIAAEIEKCKICKRGKTGKAVPGEGNPDADVVFIGEAPGKTEAETGRPFVGRAGKILRQLIKEAGLKDEEVYITSPVKYLPKYVTPTLSDIEHGKKHLFQQIKIIEPKFVVLLGRVASYAFLERNVEVAKEHGKVVEKDGIKYFIAYHPAAPLHNPNLKKQLIKDFKDLKKHI